MARQRFREGVQYYDQHQFEKARLAFLQAYALKPHPSVLLNLAQSELRSGHPDDAASHFSQYLRVNTTATDAERQETTAGYNTAKSRVGEITLTVDPAGAQVLVDGVEKGLAPLPDPLYVLPGSHTIEARSNDRHASKSLTLSAGQSVTVQLAPRGSIAAAGAPALAETAAPTELPETGAGENPPPEQKQPEGSTTVDEKADAHVETSTTGGHQGLFEWFAATPPAWIVAGVGVVGLGVGVTMAFVSNHNHSNANAVADGILAEWNKDTGVNMMSDAERFASTPEVGPCTIPSNTNKISPGRLADYNANCAQYQSRKNSGDSAQTVAIVSTIVGSAAIVGTVVYYFIDRKSEGGGSASTGGVQVHVVPVMGSGQTGIGLFGSF
jgi:hypothetical protein